MEPNVNFLVGRILYTFQKRYANGDDYINDHDSESYFSIGINYDTYERDSDLLKIALSMYAKDDKNLNRDFLLKLFPNENLINRVNAENYISKSWWMVRVLFHPSKELENNSDMYEYDKIRNYKNMNAFKIACNMNIEAIQAWLPKDLAYHIGETDVKVQDCYFNWRDYNLNPALTTYDRHLKFAKRILTNYAEILEESYARWYKSK